MLESTKSITAVKNNSFTSKREREREREREERIRHGNSK
jgi:hypothetical protein